MFYYNAELTLVMLIFVPLSVGVTLIYTPILKSFSQRAFLARAEQSSVLIDSLHGIDVVKAEAVEPRDAMALGRQVHKGNSDWLSAIKNADVVWGDRPG